MPAIDKKALPPQRREPRLAHRGESHNDTTIMLRKAVYIPMTLVPCVVYAESQVRAECRVSRQLLPRPSVTSPTGGDWGAARISVFGVTPLQVHPLLYQVWY